MTFENAANTEELEPVEELSTVREKLDAVLVYPEGEPRRPDDVGDVVVTAWNAANPANPAEKVTAWNAANPAGTSVWFHLDTGSKQLTKTMSKAWLFADRIPVVLIEGQISGVSLSRLKPVQTVETDERPL